MTTSRLLPMLSIFAAIGIFFTYVNPLWNGQIAQAQAGIAADNQALASAAAYVKRENELAAQMAAIDPAALTRLETFLPDSVNNIGLILDLNALAARSGLSIESVDVADTTASAASASPSSANPIGSIDMKLTAKGTYDALQSFLSGVELSERLLDVRSITVTGSNTGVYDYDMMVRIYWLR